MNVLLENYIYCGSLRDMYLIFAFSSDREVPNLGIS